VQIKTVGEAGNLRQVHPSKAPLNLYGKKYMDSKGAMSKVVPSHHPYRHQTTVIARTAKW
jgi:hypothetical protein